VPAGAIIRCRTKRQKPVAWSTSRMRRGRQATAILVKPCRPFTDPQPTSASSSPSRTTTPFSSPKAAGRPSSPQLSSTSSPTDVSSVKIPTRPRRSTTSSRAHGRPRRSPKPNGSAHRLHQGAKRSPDLARPHRPRHPNSRPCPSATNMNSRKTRRLSTIATTRRSTGSNSQRQARRARSHSPLTLYRTMSRSSPTTRPRSSRVPSQTLSGTQ
jgi:hypothetical protein